jgi:hypothetical protein
VKPNVSTRSLNRDATRVSVGCAQRNRATRKAVFSYNFFSKVSKLIFFFEILLHRSEFVRNLNWAAVAVARSHVRDVAAVIDRVPLPETVRSNTYAHVYGTLRQLLRSVQFNTVLFQQPCIGTDYTSSDKPGPYSVQGKRECGKGCNSERGANQHYLCNIFHEI